MPMPMPWQQTPIELLDTLRVARAAVPKTVRWYEEARRQPAGDDNAWQSVFWGFEMSRSMPARAGAASSLRRGSAVAGHDAERGAVAAVRVEEHVSFCA